MISSFGNDFIIRNKITSEDLQISVILGIPKNVADSQAVADLVVLAPKMAAVLLAESKMNSLEVQLAKSELLTELKKIPLKQESEE